MSNPYPILEFDPTREAIIEPGRLARPIDAPEHCVVCFFQEVIAKVCGGGQAEILAQSSWEHGTHPVYEIEWKGQRLGVFHPGVGAPMAVGLMEEVIPSNLQLLTSNL